MAHDIPGYVLDLGGWNLPDDEEKLRKFVMNENPEVCIGRSLDTLVTSLQTASVRRRRSRSLVCAHKYQLMNGKHFVHEAPVESEFWKDPFVCDQLAQAGTHVARGPLRTWTFVNEEGELIGYVRRQVRWLTSDPHLAKVLADNRDRLGDRVVLVGGNGGVGPVPVYPPGLVALVLKVVKGSVLHSGSVSAAASPVADRAELTQGPEYEEYWDDINGGYLGPELTRQARQLEIQWVLKEKVYSYCRPEDAKGQKIITLKMGGYQQGRS